MYNIGSSQVRQPVPQIKKQYKKPKDKSISKNIVQAKLQNPERKIETNKPQRTPKKSTKLHAQNNDDIRNKVSQKVNQNVINAKNGVIESVVNNIDSLKRDFYEGDPATNVSQRFSKSMSRVSEESAKLSAVVKEQVQSLGSSNNQQLYTAFSAAAIVGIGFQIFRGDQAAQEYFAAYVIEQSLSLDNLFVFVLIFKFFKVPLEYQNVVLNWGVIGAAILRGIFILAGSGLIEKFHPVLLIFAAILVYQSVQILLSSKDDDDEDLSDNSIIKFFKQYVSFTDQYHGKKFFVKLEETGKWVATPLFLALLTAEVSDILFAVDSIPAVFGVTLDPSIVYTSNMFAIISLRSMFQFVQFILEKLQYLDKAVGLVLGFIGVKLCLEYFNIQVPTSTSLEIILIILGSGALLSIIFKEQEVVEEKMEEQQGQRQEIEGDNIKSLRYSVNGSMDEN